MEVAQIHPGNSPAFASLLAAPWSERLEAADTLLLGAVEDGVAAGALAATVEGDSISIFWLYVAQAYRGKGAATLLLEQLESIASAHGLYRLRAVFTQEDDLDALMWLFARENYVLHTSGQELFTFSLSQVAQEDLRRLADRSYQVLSLEQLPDITLRLLGNQLAQSGDALVELPLDKERYLPCSTVALKDGKPVGACLVDSDSQGLELSFLYVLPTAKRAIPSMLLSVFDTAKGEYGEQAGISLLSVDANTRKMVERLVESPHKKIVCTAEKELHFDLYR